MKKLGRPPTNQPLGKMMWIPGQLITEVSFLLKEYDERKSSGLVKYCDKCGNRCMTTTSLNEYKCTDCCIVYAWPLKPNKKAAL